MRKIIILLALISIFSACHSGRYGGVRDGGAADEPGSGSESPPDISAPEDASGWAAMKKGFNFACWYAGCFQDDGVEESLNALVTTGADWVAVVPTWYQDNTRSSQIAPDSQKSATDDDIRAVVAMAREKGLKILLKPHIDLNSGQWRGDILPAQLFAWEQSYKNFILHFAGLCEDLGIEVLSIGTELKRMSSSTVFWDSLVPEIRNAYSGSLTYSANWDEYDNVEFWDLLDFIGIDFYFPIARTATATRADMVSGLSSISTDIGEFSSSIGKKVILTELGYRSVDGSAMRPWDYGFSAREDLEEQALAYAAVLEAYENVPWLDGAFWWRWDTRLESDREGYTIYGKPAADVLTQVWHEAVSSGGGGGGTLPPPVSSSEGGMSFVVFGDWGSRGSDDQRGVALAIGNYCAINPCDFIFTLGDNFYSDGVESTADSHWQESYRDVYGNLGLDFYAILGNHDMNGSVEAQINYSNIDSSWHMPAQEYNLCLPEGANPCIVEIFALNSNYEHFGEEGAERGAAWSFLTNAMSSSTAVWKIIADHHPIISNGTRHGDWEQGDDPLAFLTGLYCDNEADMLLSGHDHIFSHLQETVNGCSINQLIVGTGGRGLHTVDESDPRVLSSGSFYGFGWIQVTATTFTFRMIDTNGEEFYSFELAR